MPRNELTWGRTDYVYTAIVIVFTLLLYRDTLSYEGIYDDNMCCLKNPAIRPSKTTLFDILKQDFWGVNINDAQSNTQWRPLTTLTYRIDYVLWCQNDPRNTYGNTTGIMLNDSPCLRGWRITNLSLAALVSALVYATSRLVAGIGPSAALFAGLLFAAHPVHIESYATLYGRADVICAALHLAACCLAARKHFVPAFLLGLLSITAKESGLGTLLAIPLCAWMTPYTSQSPKKQEKRVQEAKSSWTLVSFIRNLVSNPNFPGKAFSVGAALAGSVVAVRRSLISRWGPPMSWVDNPYAFLPDSATSRWLSITHIHARYLLWLFAPLGHSPNYGWDTIPPVMSPQDPRNIITAIAYAFLLAGVMVSLVRGWWREVALIVWAGALFLPASNVFFYVGTAFADRLLYLPTVPFCILAGTLFHRIKANFGRAKIFGAKILFVLLATAAAVVVAMATLTTAARLPAWRNGGAVWEAAEKQFPRNVVAVHNLALDRQMHNRQEEAAALFGRLADIMESSEFEEARNDKLGNTGREAKLWAEHSAEAQRKMKETDPAAVLELVKGAVKDLEEGKALVEPFALMRDVLLSGVMENSQEIEDWILKNTFALHMKHNRVRDLFQIVRVHVIPRRKELFLDWSVPKEILDVIAPMIDGEL